MPVIEGVVQVISAVRAAKWGLDFLTGNTVGQHVKRLRAEVDRLADHVYYRNVQEVRDPALATQKLITDREQILDAAAPLQGSLNCDVLLSTPIETPEKLRARLGANPEDVLYDIQPVVGEASIRKHERDPTMVAVTFERWGQHFVGYMKRGYAEDYGFLYAPAAEESTSTLPSSSFVVSTGAQVTPEQVKAAEQAGVPVAFENDLGMRFVLIPPGAFLMGFPRYEGTLHQYPRHEVRIATPFYLQTTPVTNRQYSVLRPEYFCDAEFSGDLQPAIHIPCDESRRFAKDLGRVDGQHRYRLPTEAEWEYACRAGTTSAYWSGSDESDLALVGWYEGNSGGRTHNVGSKPPNPWGLHDMHGNVWEWCEDKWHDSYKRAPEDGSAWGGLGRERVKRGGSWDSAATDCGSAMRGSCGPVLRLSDFGMRPVCPLPR